MRVQTWITREQSCKLSGRKDREEAANLYFHLPKGFWLVPVNESRGATNVGYLLTYLHVINP